MKNAFGSTLIFMIVIFFVILFTGYICLSINQAKAFNMKNEIVKAVERFAPDLEDEGFQLFIQNALVTEGYRLDGRCSDGYEGYDEYGNNTHSDHGAFCIAEVTVNNPKLSGTKLSGTKLSGRYYKIETFYQLEIPIIQSLFQLKATGETKIIYGS